MPPDQFKFVAGHAQSGIADLVLEKEGKGKPFPSCSVYHQRWTALMVGTVALKRLPPVAGSTEGPWHTMQVSFFERAVVRAS